MRTFFLYLPTQGSFSGAKCARCTVPLCPQSINRSIYPDPSGSPLKTRGLYEDHVSNVYVRCMSHNLCLFLVQRLLCSLKCQPQQLQLWSCQCFTYLPSVGCCISNTHARYCRRRHDRYNVAETIEVTAGDVLPGAVIRAPLFAREGAVEQSSITVILFLELIKISAFSN